VADVGLDTASDRDIWAYARQDGAVIIARDDDFRILAGQQGSIPPQVVWVRLGNWAIRKSVGERGAPTESVFPLNIVKPCCFKRCCRRRKSA